MYEVMKLKTIVADKRSFTFSPVKVAKIEKNMTKHDEKINQF